MNEWRVVWFDIQRAYGIFILCCEFNIPIGIMSIVSWIMLVSSLCECTHHAHVRDVLTVTNVFGRCVIVSHFSSELNDFSFVSRFRRVFILIFGRMMQIFPRLPFSVVHFVFVQLQHYIFTFFSLSLVSFLHYRPISCSISQPIFSQCFESPDKSKGHLLFHRSSGFIRIVYWFSISNKAIVSVCISITIPFDWNIR